MTSDPTTARHRATAATAIALGLEAALDKGVPDAVIADEVVRVALALIATARGGESGLADWLEAEAALIRKRGDAPRPDTIN